ISMGKLLPPAALPRGTGWIAVVLSMMIIWAQPAGSPLIYVPAAFCAAVTFVIGSHLAHVPDGGVAEAFTLSTQAVAAAVVMTIAVRAGRDAARAFAELESAEREAHISQTRRAAELAQ